jgi:hypothetical protein
LPLGEESAPCATCAVTSSLRATVGLERGRAFRCKPDAAEMRSNAGRRFSACPRTLSCFSHQVSSRGA